MGSAMVNPEIPLQTQTPRPSDPLEAYARVTALKQALGAQQVQQQQLTALGQENQQRALALQDQQTMRQAFIESNGDPEKLMSIARQKGVGPQAILGLQNSLLDMKTKVATLNKDELANHLATNSQLQSLVAPAAKEADPAKATALWNQAVQSAVEQKLIPPAEAAKHPYPGPDGAKAYAAGLNMSSWALRQEQDATANKNNTEAGVAQQKIDWLKNLKANPQAADQQIDSILSPKLDSQANAAYKAALRVAGTPEAAESIIKAATSHAGDIAKETNPGVMNAKAKQAGMNASAELPSKVAAEFAAIPAHVQQAVQTQLAVAKNSPEAFSGITDPTERHRAEQSYEKISMDAAGQVGDSKKLQDFVKAAQSGNKAAGALIPLAEIRAIVNRVNTTELKSAGAPGDIVDKGIGVLNGWTKGVPMSPEGLKAVADLANVTQQAIGNKYKAQVDVLNKTYGGKAQPVDLQNAFGAAAPVKNKLYNPSTGNFE